MEKKTLISLSCTQEVKHWFDAKRRLGWNLSAIFGRVMDEVIAREARTGDWLAHDDQPCGGGVLEAQWGADEAKEILGIVDDDDE